MKDIKRKLTEWCTFHNLEEEEAFVGCENYKRAWANCSKCQHHSLKTVHKKSIRELLKYPLHPYFNLEG